MVSASLTEAEKHASLPHLGSKGASGSQRYTLSSPGRGRPSFVIGTQPGRVSVRPPPSALPMSHVPGIPSTSGWTRNLHQGF